MVAVGKTARLYINRFKSFHILLSSPKGEGGFEVKTFGTVNINSHACVSLPVSYEKVVGCTEHLFAIDAIPVVSTSYMLNFTGSCNEA